VCGITGWVDWERDLRDERTVAERMTDTMACRGPDARGLWLSHTAAIGHRRLAIIDLSGGTQPMAAALAAEGGRVVLTYSGEIYNFQELRRQLQSSGHRFDTRSDTEVVLRSYLQWGPSCVERFNGMFAFAIWDENEQELLLARDHLGIKPLYYHPYDGGLIFGSEPKAIIANPLFEPVLDDEGVAELFAMFGSRSPGVTALRGLQEVRPGHIVRVGRNGVRPIRYWQVQSSPHLDGPVTTAHTVREILADTVGRQLVSDVPLCALVSGGLDSSVVAALAARQLSGHRRAPTLSTFSVDFTGSVQDFVADANRPSLDAPYVRALVEHIGSRHTDVVLETPDLLAIQERATLARDLPCLGDLDGSLYMLFKAIQGRSTVALSGESADEVFGGYAWFHDPAAVGRDGFPWIMDDAGFGNVLRADVKARVRPEEYVRNRYAEALAEVPRLDGETGPDRRMREVSYLALTRFLPVLLDRKDRMSMAVGLEVRVPYCDHRLVEYLWNVPWALKCPDGVPKGLLRKAVDDLLPAELVHRPKSMFPVTPDPTYDATVRALAQQLVESDSAAGALLDATRVRALVDGSSRRPPWMQRLALAYLLQVDLWLRTYGVRVAVTV
jgi:asparagine synthase (glutamine-hydrolysing)